MNKLENLFIRACKSHDPVKRLNTLYKRFYITDPNPMYINNILVTIVDKYHLASVKSVLEYFNPRNPFGQVSADYDTKTLNYLVNTIALSHITKFPPTYQVPLAHRLTQVRPIITTQ